MIFPALELAGLLLAWPAALPPVQETPRAQVLDAPRAGAPTAPRAQALDGDALQAAMARLAREHPQRVELFSLGRSRHGREIGALRVSAATDEVPAVLLVANVDGPFVYTSALALDHARRLAEEYERDERVRRALDTVTLYVVPRANPDAAEARFTAPLAERTASGRGVDNDRDGRYGEDDVADVDGDGLVTQLRVPDPEGEWIEDPADPRVLIRADRNKGQRGRWKLWPEGRDLDGDEALAEDPVHDAVVDHNFPHRNPELSPEGGRFATDEPEARALADFVLAHPEIALVVVYGDESNLAEDAPQAAGGGARGAEPLGLLEEDAALVQEVGRRYRELTESEARGTEEAPGSFAGWCYHQRGIWTLAVRPWDVPQGEGAGKRTEESPPGEGAPEQEEEGVAGRTSASADQEGAKAEEEPVEPSEEAKRLAWLEENGVSDAFVPWTAFEHPELGPVEVGGLRPYALVEPPADRWEPLAEAHLEFLLAVTELLPEARLVECQARSLAEGLYEVRAVVENAALLPLISAAGRRSRAVRPARVEVTQIGADDLERLAGPAAELVAELPGSGGRRELRWLVRCADPQTIRVWVDADHARDDLRTPEVK